MNALTLVPAQLWELLSIIVMFFFGARELSHFRSDSMAKEAARITAAAPTVIENIKQLLHDQTPGAASTDGDTDLTLKVLENANNKAVTDFNETHTR